MARAARRSDRATTGLLRCREARKTRLAMDPAPSDLPAVEFSPGRDGGAPVLPDLLGHSPRTSKSAP